MADATQYTFSHAELVEALIKRQNLHEGLWGLYVEFNLGAGNFGTDDNSLTPGAIISISKIGLIKADQPNNLTVDAAAVNPAPDTATVLSQRSANSRDVSQIRQMRMQFYVS
ncbi:MAG: hypothetical protein HY221_00980 [Candidatus Sungbacteria bacterium]|uniref:Uncharacterized protein n=1 Tax=Candidatus Sungiibacteriota bacterium TaxID=2750080 RepID=A0A932R1T9_9BACT|nr:hypothetical protein [Candidatus Sungbacteria bacterium]